MYHFRLKTFHPTPLYKPTSDGSNCAKINYSFFNLTQKICWILLHKYHLLVGRATCNRALQQVDYLGFGCNKNCYI